MKILHTSDWHIGRSLYGRKRYDEQRAFLNWLLSIVRDKSIEAVIVAGDIFDTGTPSNRAQSLYYNFLKDLSTICRHIVITGGNHDSPSFLNAPKEVLMALNVTVVGALTEDIMDEIITLKDEEGRPEAIVCAVPYLRDKDVRKAFSGETFQEKEEKLVEEIERHYELLCNEGNRLSQSFGNIPLIATGHLFATGGTVGEGERELYVGSLSRVNCSRFPKSIDYLALGHLHVPQRVGGSPYMRYSGSPIAMGFKEAGQTKKVITVDFGGTPPIIEEIEVPVFQELCHIEGDMDSIERSIEELKDRKSRAWLEIDYIGKSIVPDLRVRVEELLDGTDLEICRIKNSQILDNCALSGDKAGETLDDLTTDEVFRRCLDRHEIPESDRPDLMASYREIVQELLEEDRREE